MEDVQRRATRIVPNLKEMCYSDRLRELNLPSLVFRRMRGDMIEVFKILHGIYDENVVPFLEKPQVTSTRGNSMKLFKQPAKKNIKKHCFCNRVVDMWNTLPDNVVTSATLNAFKNSLDKHWESHPLKYNFVEDVE